MTCRRAFEIDLAGFLRDPGSAEFAGFRAHYPRCADCSAEVRIWTELHLQLQSGGAVAEAFHPAEELLLQFEERPDALDAAQRATVERHLAQCRSCQDELRVLRSFEFGNLERPAPVRAQRWRQRIADVPSWVRGVVLHPAFAYALVLLLLYPTAVKHLAPPESLPRSPAVRGAGEPESEVAAPATEQVAKRAEASGERAADYGAEVTTAANLQGERSALRSSDAAAARAALPHAASETADVSERAGNAYRLAGSGPARPAAGTHQPAGSSERQAIKGETLAKGTGRAEEQKPATAEERAVSGSAPEAPAVALAPPPSAHEALSDSIGGRARAQRAEWPVLTLQPETETGQGQIPAPRRELPGSTRHALEAERLPAATVAGESIVGGLVLRVPVQTGTAAGTALEVRVFDPGGRREIRERRTAGKTPYCDVRVPAAWLSPGRYQVELRVANRSAGEFSFQVR